MNCMKLKKYCSINYADIKVPIKNFHYQLVRIVKTFVICLDMRKPDKLSVFHANLTSMCLDPHLN